MSPEPIDAETALELYLADKEKELSEASLKGHKYRLGYLVRWCDEQGFENLNTLGGRQLHEYRLRRREDGDLDKVSEKTQMDTLRVCIRWLESIDSVEQDLSEKDDPHLAFHATDTGIDTIKQRVTERGLSLHETQTSIYFRDPDGNFLELTDWSGPDQ